MKFRKRPVIIEAEQWFPGKPVHGVVEGDRQIGSFYAHAWIDTLEGPHAVSPGDWIITGVRGEKYPCKPDIFLATYEEVKEDFQVDDIEIEDPEPTPVTKVETETLTLKRKQPPQDQGT